MCARCVRSVVSVDHFDCLLCIEYRIYAMDSQHAGTVKSVTVCMSHPRWHPPRARGARAHTRDSTLRFFILLLAALVLALVAAARLHAASYADSMIARRSRQATHERSDGVSTSQQAQHGAAHTGHPPTHSDTHPRAALWTCAAEHATTWERRESRDRGRGAWTTENQMTRAGRVSFAAC